MQRVNVRDFFNLYRNKIVKVSGLTVLVFSTLFLSMMFSTEAKAQMNMIAHDSKKIHFGILLGYNNTRFHVSHSEDFINNDTIKVLESPNTPGFNLGIVSNFKLTNRIDIRIIPTLIFAEKDLRYTEYRADGDFTFTNTIESIFLDLPVGIKYKSDRFYNNFRFYVLAGGKIDYDLASNSKKRLANDIVKLGRFDYSAEVGFGFEFYFPLFIFSPEFKFGNGINNVHVPTENLIYSDVIDKLRSRTFTISLQFEG